MNRNASSEECVLILDHSLIPSLEDEFDNRDAIFMDDIVSCHWTWKNFFPQINYLRWSSQHDVQITILLKMYGILCNQNGIQAPVKGNWYNTPRRVKNMGNLDPNMSQYLLSLCLAKSCLFLIMTIIKTEDGKTKVLNMYFEQIFQTFS